MQQGYYIDDLEPGMTASFRKTITEADIVLYAGVSGDTNPVHVDEEHAKGTMFEGRIAHGMLTASLISAVLGTKMPGPGCVYVAQSLKFLAPVRAGDTVAAIATVKEVDKDRKRVTIETVCRIGDKDVVTGEAKLMVPKRPD